MKIVINAARVLFYYIISYIIYKYNEYKYENKKLDDVYNLKKIHIIRE